MSQGIMRIDLPENEPILPYTKGSRERTELIAELARQRSEVLDIPLIIGGKEVRTGDTVPSVVPHDHGHILAHVHQCRPEDVTAAAEAAIAAQDEWANMPWDRRLAIFQRAAELIAGPHRAELNAATMLNQSKTVHQAEIDAACELIDFLRFNTHFARGVYHDHQPPISPWPTSNTMEMRPLEGFVQAITPFNFTAIGGNLPTAPAMMGNVVVWKPSRSAYVSNHRLMRIFARAGVPPGVINFLPGDPRVITDTLLAHPMYAGVHFTGSTRVFRGIWSKVAAALPHNRGYPRIVGETGGKDFIVAHPTANAAALVPGVIRSAFEYQGQKCSALSRVYVPRTLWETIRGPLLDGISQIRVGSAEDFSNFMSAVITEQSFEKCRGYIERARASPDAEVICGGGTDDSTGWFVEPTVIVARDPHYESMAEEIFGPILTVYVYPDDGWDDALELCDSTSEYALTGAVWSEDRSALEQAYRVLRNAAGNFYINDKPTGSVVGQQPFGGARASGTNDKAGSALNLIRWTSPRAIKENFAPATEWRYPWLDEPGA